MASAGTSSMLQGEGCLSSVAEASRQASGLVGPSNGTGSSGSEATMKSFRGG